MFQSYNSFGGIPPPPFATNRVQWFHFSMWLVLNAPIVAFQLIILTIAFLFSFERLGQAVITRLSSPSSGMVDGMASKKLSVTLLFSNSCDFSASACRSEGCAFESRRPRLQHIGQQELTLAGLLHKCFKQLLVSVRCQSLFAFTNEPFSSLPAVIKSSSRTDR